MNLGKQKREIFVEPLEEPIKKSEPVKPEKIEKEEPVKVGK